MIKMRLGWLDHWKNFHDRCGLVVGVADGAQAGHASTMPISAFSKAYDKQSELTQISFSRN